MKIISRGYESSVSSFLETPIKHNSFSGNNFDYHSNKDNSSECGLEDIVDNQAMCDTKINACDTYQYASTAIPMGCGLEDRVGSPSCGARGCGLEDRVG